MNGTLSYNIKVWLTSLFISSILADLMNLRYAQSMHDVLNIFAMLVGIPLLILMMGVITIPSATIMYFSNIYLFKHDVNVLSIKLILSVLGLLLTFLSISIFGDFQFTADFFITASPYFLAVLISIWVYRLKPHYKNISEFQ